MHSNPDPFRRPVDQDEYEHGPREAHSGDRSLAPARPARPSIQSGALPAIMTPGQVAAWDHATTVSSELRGAMSVVRDFTYAYHELDPRDPGTAQKLHRLGEAAVRGLEQRLERLARGDFPNHY
jgi:hypothetical protein